MFGAEVPCALSLDVTSIALPTLVISYTAILLADAPGAF